MNSLRPSLRLMLLTGLFVLHPSSFILAQGSLTPPGAPAPTMKTLDQLEPRTPISALPFSISTSGSYYVTGNLTGVAGLNGITIAADNVTLDLGGFELAGGGTGLAGIRVLNANATIRNGTLRGWSSGGVSSTATETHADHLRVLSCNVNGLRLSSNGTARNCEVRAITGSGIFTGVACKVIECTAAAQTGAGSPGFQIGADCTVRDCVATGNAGHGFQGGAGCVFAGCVGAGNTGSGFNLGDHSSVSGCGARGNTSDGFTATSDCQFTSCFAAGNGAAGFSSGAGAALTGCGAASNVDGFNHADLATLLNCTASGNSNAGIFVGRGSTLTGFAALNNGTTGAIATTAILAGNGSVLAHCSATGNAAARAISTGTGCSLTHCTARENTSNATASAGIFATAQSTLTGCTASGNTNTGALGFGAGTGIFAGDGSTVTGCTADANAGDGFRININTVITGCTASGNGVGAGDGGGIHAVGTRNRLEGNNVQGNDRGIDVDSTASLIIKNSASNNTLNYEIATSNRYGPIVDITAAGAAPVSGNTAPDTTTTTHPWANFAY